MGPPHPQFYPLQLNEETGEPYLRLPAPHTNIVITPPRTTDKLTVFEILNDARVWDQFGSPQPYREEHAEDWLNHVKSMSDALLQELEEASKNEETDLKIVQGCPVRILREEKENGEEVYLGDCAVKVSIYGGVRPGREKAIREGQRRKKNRRSTNYLGDGRYALEH